MPVLIFLLAFLGLLFGGIVGGALGALSGAGFGLLLGLYIDLRKRIEVLEAPQRRAESVLPPPPQTSPPSTRDVQVADAPVQPQRPVAPVYAPTPYYRKSSRAPSSTVTPSTPARPSTPASSSSPVSSSSPTSLSSPKSPSAPASPSSPPQSTIPAVGSPSILSTLIKGWLARGNLPVTVGVLVSLVGLGLLIQEANERGFITLTVEMGIIAVALFGLVMLAIGWRLRETHRIYGLSLQGGGVAVLYLTTYAAFAVYDVIGALPGGLAVVLITVGAGVLAVLQDARSLAVLGIVGGFLAPVLVYRQPEDNVALFGFYVVLSAAIVVVAWFKVWQELNLLGWVLTFAISAQWLNAYYDSDDWLSTQPFIALLILLYIAIPPLFAFKKVPDIADPWTAPLIFGTPFTALGLQYLLLNDSKYGLAASSLVLAAILATLALYTRGSGIKSRPLSSAYAALAVTFLAIAVPFGLNANFTSTTWALQGAVLVWFGCRHQQMIYRYGGLLLQVLAALAFLVFLDSEELLGGDQSGLALYPNDTLPIVNVYFVGFAALAAAGFVSAWLYRERKRDETELELPWLTIIWGLLFWVAGGLWEIASHLSSAQLSASLGFMVATFGVAVIAATYFNWAQLATLGLMITPTLLVTFVISASIQTHPLDEYGWVVWPLALVANYGFLRAREGVFTQFSSALHAASYFLLAALLGIEIFWQVNQFADGIWPTFATLGGGILLTAATMRTEPASGGTFLDWPLNVHRRTYMGNCAGVLLLVLAAWATVLIFVSSADPSPLPYLPVLHPLGLLVAALFAVSLHWKRLAESLEKLWLQDLAKGSWIPVLAVFGVGAVTMEVARTVHHWLDVEWELEALVTSTTLQASLSLIWAAVGLGGMVVGVRLAHRLVWMAGVSLMAVVVVKLFLVDLSNLTAVARVVSFLGVGILLLIVGYLAPVPPANSNHSTKSTNSTHSNHSTKSTQEGA